VGFAGRNEDCANRKKLNTNTLHSQDIPRRIGSTPDAGQARTLIFITLVLLIGYGFALRHSLDFAIDGKTFYLSGKAMIVGGDFYDPAVEKSLSERFAPDGENAHLFAHLLTHPPITPVLFAPLSVLPWSVFRLLLLAMNVVSIPVIAWLCLRLVDRISVTGLWLAAAFIAVLPPVWQAIKLGQIALPMLACALLAAHCFLQKRSRWLAFFVVLAMVKPTFCVPLLAYLFLIGKTRTRLAMLAAGGIYAALNVIGMVRLQMQEISFVESYRRALNASFSGGGLNDPRLMGAIRLDVEVLLANVSYITPQIAKYAVVIVAAGAFWWATRRFLGRENESQFGACVAAMLLLGLILFYHRSYDAVLLLPAFFVGLAGAWPARNARREYSRRALHGALAVTALLCLAAIGSDERNALNMVLKTFGTSQPLWFKAACVLVCYGLMVAILKILSSKTQGENA
jgi:hypothetical protein